MFKPKTKTINLMLLDGGLGDHIGSLVAVDYILKKYKHVKPIIWVPDYLKELSIYLLPPEAEVFSISEVRGKYEPTRPTKTTKWDGITSPMKIHTVDYAFLKLCDENPSIFHKNYLRFKETPMTHLIPNQNREYVVITTGYTAEVKEFKPKAINEIARYLVSKNILPVFLGQKQTKTGGQHIIEGKFSEEIDFSLGLNLIDKTSLIEAGNIISRAKAIVGVDNGLIHLAGCTDTPIVAGYTIVTPLTKMPIRHNTIGHGVYPITPGLECQGCQVKTNFLYGHDYKKCYLKEAKVTESIVCVTKLTSDKFIPYLDHILK